MAEVGISPVSNGWMAGPGDLKSRSDRILVKVALEGKSFQAARAEVEAEFEAQEAPVSREGESLPAKGRRADTVAVDVLEVRGLAVDVHLTHHGEEIRARLETLSVRRIQARAPAPAPPPKDPLVIDFSGAGPQTTGAAGARAFDLAADGDLRGTSFVAGDTAFLALDRNGNGRIDSGAELFGDQHGAANGYEELAKFDANGDARIDAADPVFADLLLLAGDGTTRAAGDAGLTAFDLSHVAAPGTTLSGDAIFARGWAHLESGRSLQTYALGLNRFDLQA